MKIINFFLFCTVFLVFESAIAKADPNKLTAFLAPKAIPLKQRSDLDQLIETAGSNKLVLLGESTHGTHEFYHWRSEISKRLITEKGFSFIAVEGDWPSLYRLNEYVKGRSKPGTSAADVLKTFGRWPRWMWANQDIEALAEWLREFNKTRPEADKIGLFGMDVYGQWEAIDDLLALAGAYFPEQLPDIQRRLNCFKQYDRDEWMYARATARGGFSCEKELTEVLEIIQNLKPKPSGDDPKIRFRARQKALVIKNAEDFFRLAIREGPDAWNSRVKHMWVSIEGLLERHGTEAKGIIWAHNTHVGDASKTTMILRETLNIGQLSRQALGADQVHIVGFGTDQGKVNAGAYWGAPMSIMTVPKAQPGSIEEVFARLGPEAFYLIFSDEDRRYEPLDQLIGNRAIGVIYDPRRDYAQYVASRVAQRYDSFVFIKNTRELTPVR